jgi:hypothetical protein
MHVDWTVPGVWHRNVLFLSVLTTRSTNYSWLLFIDSSSNKIPIVLVEVNLLMGWKSWLLTYWLTNKNLFSVKVDYLCQAKSHNTSGNIQRSVSHYSLATEQELLKTINFFPLSGPSQVPDRHKSSTERRAMRGSAARSGISHRDRWAWSSGRIGLRRKKPNKLGKKVTIWL